MEEMGFPDITVAYFAGQLTEEGYDPNLFIIVDALPVGYGLGDYVDDEVSAALIDTPNAQLTSRVPRTIGGQAAEQLAQVTNEGLRSSCLGKRRPVGRVDGVYCIQAIRDVNQAGG